MPLKWVGDKNLLDLNVEIEERKAAILFQCQTALRLCVEQGAADLVEYLEKATTKTGLAREQAGLGVPGRHRSGLMVNSVSSNANNLTNVGYLVIGSFGWFANAFQEYFKDQDAENSLGIPPAHALMHAATKAQIQFRIYMTAITRGEPIG